ncbi:hypothetical protein BCR34DRAFT_490468 [Clohesyomyces aquaticus]|uniref:DUF6594 domain-containing protein n=1 Tax=Clohesyomyces aquaticus TaxID=1231657 RepID=A0A1Y1Z7S0_9PLEO|nr:hypothetical protein BCR34DRAFT_490468 [Clohesyomyces aquaticus]
MALDPDKEALIFRKFDYLNARRLLHLQSELTELEDQLHDLDAQSRKDVDSKKSLKKHEIFVERAEVQDSTDQKRSALLIEIHSKLNEYHNTLVLESQVASLHAPPMRALKAYRSYFSGEGPMDRIVFGKAQAALNDGQDFVTLQPAPETDVLSRFVRDHWSQQLRSSIHPNPNETTLRFREMRIGLIVGLINIIAALVLIIGAVVSLFKLRTKPDSVRLGSIAGFTAFFAITLGLLTNVKRAEVFAAMAAYAAVLVVFVSGDLGGSGGNKV